MKLKQYYFVRTDKFGQIWKHVFMSLRTARAERDGYEDCKTVREITPIKAEDRKYNCPVVIGPSNSGIFYLKRA